MHYFQVKEEALSECNYDGCIYYLPIIIIQLQININ